MIPHLDERWITRGKERLITGVYHESIDGHDIRIAPIERSWQWWGFVTDGGTIPQFAWSIVGHPFGEFFFPYLRHDWRWSMRHLFPGMTFQDSNDLLYGDLLHYGRSKSLAYATYQAVQLGGKGIWKRGEAKSGDLDFHFMAV